MKSLQEIAFAFAFVALLFGATAFYAYALEIPGTSSMSTAGIPFGGYIVSYVPSTIICPGHSLIYDLRSQTIMGIAVMPGSRIYERGNLFTSGTAVLGAYFPTFFPCLLPYPVHTINQVGTS